CERWVVVSATQVDNGFAVW
nr:immunoglobulin heavy chain junction region [Macaca mulatta]